LRYFFDSGKLTRRVWRQRGAGWLRATTPPVWSYVKNVHKISCSVFKFWLQIVIAD